MGNVAVIKNTQVTRSSIPLPGSKGRRYPWLPGRERLFIAFVAEEDVENILKSRVAKLGTMYRPYRRASEAEIRRWRGGRG